MGRKEREKREERKSWANRVKEQARERERKERFPLRETSRKVHVVYV